MWYIFILIDNCLSFEFVAMIYFVHITFKGSYGKEDGNLRKIL